MPIRLDTWLVQHNHCDSREKAKQAIEEEAIKVNSIPVKKGSFLVEEDDVVEIAVASSLRYVSRGGLKLEKALREFRIDCTDKTVLDIGASTGGFTDCVLQHGAKRVIALDVGSDQLHYSLRKNPKVISLENTDIRNFDAEEYIENVLDLIVIDLSFIGLKHVLPSVQTLCGPKTQVITLIKPQFEADKKIKTKNGIVVNQRDRDKILEKSSEIITGNGFKIHKIIMTDADGTNKNIEYLAYLTLI